MEHRDGKRFDIGIEVKKLINSLTKLNQWKKKPNTYYIKGYTSDCYNAHTKPTTQTTFNAVKL